MKLHDSKWRLDQVADPERRFLFELPGTEDLGRFLKAFWKRIFGLLRRHLADIPRQIPDTLAIAPPTNFEHYGAGVGRPPGRIFVVAALEVRQRLSRKPSVRQPGMRLEELFVGRLERRVFRCG